MKSWYDRIFLKFEGHHARFMNCEGMPVEFRPKPVQRASLSPASLATSPQEAIRGYLLPAGTHSNGPILLIDSLPNPAVSQKTLDRFVGLGANKEVAIDDEGGHCRDAPLPRKPPVFIHGRPEVP